MAEREGNCAEGPVQLEIQLAFLERTLESLHAVVLEQGQILDRQQRKLQELEARLQAGLSDSRQDLP